MTRGKGYIRDHAEIVRSHVSHLLGAKYGEATPDAVDLEPGAPSVMDQGSGSFGTSSCTGHGTSVGIVVALGAKSPFVPSPRGIYGVARAVDRHSPLDPLTDSGAMPDQVIRGIGVWGLRPIQAPTSDGRYSDVEPSNATTDPSLGDLESDSRDLAVGSHAITSTGADRIRELREALAAGYPVCFGTFVDAAFEAWKAGDPPMGVPDYNDPNGGGHWLCLLGYATNPDGSTTWKVRNSWGASWGRNGNFVATDAFMQQVTDLYVLSVTLGGAS